jgi:hypothetical protein
MRSLRRGDAPQAGRLLRVLLLRIGALSARAARRRSKWLLHVTLVWRSSVARGLAPPARTRRGDASHLHSVIHLTSSFASTHGRVTGRFGSLTSKGAKNPAVGDREATSTSRDHARELVPECRQLRQLRLHLREVRPRHPVDIGAGAKRIARGEGQEVADLVQREAKVPGASQEVDALDVAIAEESIASRSDTLRCR